MAERMKVTEEVLAQMPDHVREWVEKACRTSNTKREVIEYQLAFIGIENFVNTFEYQKEYADYWDNF
jgi:hypothetical protein